MPGCLHWCNTQGWLAHSFSAQRLQAQSVPYELALSDPAELHQLVSLLRGTFDSEAYAWVYLKLLRSHDSRITYRCRLIGLLPWDSSYSLFQLGHIRKSAP